MKSSNLTALLPGVLAIVLSMGCQAEEKQVPVLVQHEKQYPDVSKKYVYQSLLRLANINKDPEYEKLIKDIHKITLYLPPPEDSTYQIKSVRTGLTNEGYEPLIDVRTADKQRMSLWVKETGEDTHYIALADGEEDIILEIDGQVNIEYLPSLTNANEGSLMNLLKGGF